MGGWENFGSENVGNGAGQCLPLSFALNPLREGKDQVSGDRRLPPMVRQKFTSHILHIPGKQKLPLYGMRGYLKLNML